MANSGSNSALKFTGIAVVVIAGSALAGYFLAGGVHSPSSSTSTQVVSQPSGADTPPASDNAAVVRPSAPRSRSDDYTAPGAPTIHIHEEPNPLLKRPKPSDTAPKPDSEASQEAAPTPKANPAPSTPAPDPNASPDAAAPPTAPDTPVTPAAPGDADYEKTPAPTPGDAEASQQGDTAPRGPIYRVQAGTFDQARNAHMLADVLKDRGYTTSTIAERRPDKTVYHVQIGAYRNKSTAKQSALDLQKMGYPAYVAGGG